MRTCKRFSDDTWEHLWDDWEILDNLSYEIYTKRSDVWGLHQLDFVICLRIIWNCVEELIAQKSYLKIVEIKIHIWHIEKSDENRIFEIKSESTMKQENGNTWTSVEVVQSDICQGDNCFSNHSRD